MKQVKNELQSYGLIILVILFAAIFTQAQTNADIEGNATISGNLGVGTSTPAAKFQVIGNSYLTGPFNRVEGSSAIGTWLSLGNTTAGGKYFNILSTGVSNSEGAGKLLIIPANIVSGGPSAFSIDGTTFYTGIGTHSPTHNLHIRNVGKASIMIEADTDNAGESDQPSLLFSQDGGLETSRIGYFNGSNAWHFQKTSLTGDGIYFSNNNVVQLSLAANGKVGIGTDNPVPTIPNARLDVTGGHIILSSDFGVLSRKSDGSFSAGFDTNPEGKLFLYSNGSSKVTVDTFGQVGIGTSNPSWPLQIVNSAPGGSNATPNWYLLGSATNEGDAVAGPGSGWSYSIHASGGMYSGLGFATGSDARIKDIVGRSNAAQDLAALMNVEVTNYTMKDDIQHGNTIIKKVIAQQVEQVLPNAITKSVGVIPDIYEKAKVSNGWIQLATDLKVGEKVKVITSSGEKVCEVTAVDPTQFQVSDMNSEEHIFVYGRQVGDFRSVDYDAISMLHVSATQAQQQLIEKQQKEIDMLKEEINKMRADLKLFSQLAQVTNE